jgi:hypothetical protein
MAREASSRVDCVRKSAFSSPIPEPVVDDPRLPFYVTLALIALLAALHPYPLVRGRPLANWIWLRARRRAGPRANLGVSALGRILVLASAGLLVVGILEDSLALQLIGAGRLPARCAARRPRR